MKQKEKLLTSGEYSMVQFANGFFYVRWTDKVQNRTVRRSLKTNDQATAHAAFHRFLEQTRDSSVDPANVETFVKDKTFFETLELYRDHVGSKLASSDSVNAAIKKTHAHMKDCAIRTFSEGAQDRLLKAWDESGLASGTSERYFAVLRTAINWANKKTLINQTLEIKTVQTKHQKRTVNRKGDRLTPKQVATLFDNVKSPHVQTTLVFLSNTASRLAAVLELKDDQIDRERGIIRLNPKNRQQTKKWRPTIWVPETLRPWLNYTGPEGHFIFRNGKPVSCIKTAMRKLNSLPEFAGMMVNSYSFRHAVARYLFENGVDEREIAFLLGHRRNSSNPTTNIYIENRDDEPEDLTYATKMIEQFVLEVDSHCKINSPLFHKSLFAPH